MPVYTNPTPIPVLARPDWATSTHQLGTRTDEPHTEGILHRRDLYEAQLGSAGVSIAILQSYELLLDNVAVPTVETGVPYLSIDADLIDEELSVKAALELGHAIVDAAETLKKVLDGEWLESSRELKRPTDITEQLADVEN